MKSSETCWSIISTGYMMTFLISAINLVNFTQQSHLLYAKEHPKLKTCI